MIPERIIFVSRGITVRAEVFRDPTEAIIISSGKMNTDTYGATSCLHLHDRGRYWPALLLIITSQGW